MDPTSLRTFRKAGPTGPINVSDHGSKIDLTNIPKDWFRWAGLRMRNVPEWGSDRCDERIRRWARPVWGTFRNASPTGLMDVLKHGSDGCEAYSERVMRLVGLWMRNVPENGSDRSVGSDLFPETGSDRPDEAPEHGSDRSEECSGRLVGVV